MTEPNESEFDEYGVSPVVGVMLMLVVTIIIAAVVSSMAGGISGKTEKPPSASFDVKITTGAFYNNTCLTIKHLGGDTIDTKDLAIITYYTNKTGGVYTHTQTRSSNASLIYSSSTTDVRVPYLADMTTGYAYKSPETKDFGNFSLQTGDVMTSYNIGGTADLLGIPWTKDTTLSDPFVLSDTSLKPGSIVDVKILHIPSDKIIYDNKVAVR